MLALNREIGEITDFYVDGEHLISVISSTESAAPGMLNLYACTKFIEGDTSPVETLQLLGSYNPEDGTVSLEIEHKDVMHPIDFCFYKKMSGGSLIMGLSIPSKVSVVRREVLERDGLKKCFNLMNNRRGKQ